jgi:Holliday junction resolvasome RuvABC ATP-dependent DNA helicase subunit
MDNETPKTPPAQVGETKRIQFPKVRLSEVSGFEELIGQRDCIERLEKFGELYSTKNLVPEHILLAGNEDLGTLVLARAFAKTFNAALVEQDAKYFEKSDLDWLLNHLDLRAALFLNLEDFPKSLIPYFVSALEHHNFEIGNGVLVQTMGLNRFTFLGTAPRVVDVPPDLLKCFSLTLTLQPYSNSELQAIAVLLAARNGLTLSDGVTALLVSASQRTPHSIAKLLRRFAILGKTEVTEEDAKETLAAFGLTARPINNVSDPSELDSLSGVEFEKLILSLLQRMGFRAEMTRTTGDGGIDIVANLDKPIIGGRYLIQCKRFAESLIGAPVVREFYGAIVADRKAVKGILITTSNFTAQAREFTETLPLELVDRIQLINLLAEFKPDD